MSLKLTTTVLALCSAVLLSGCLSNVRVETRIVIPEISSSILVCAEKPKRPGGDFSERDVAIYIERMSGAHSNCKNNLKAVDASLKAAKAEAIAKAKAEAE